MTNKVRLTAQDVVDYLEDQLRLFDVDPPDSSFQRGYQNALQTVIDEINGMREGKALSLRYLRLLRRRATKPS